MYQSCRPVNFCGQSFVVDFVEVLLSLQKKGGKVFEIKRVDVREKSILKGLDRLLHDIPNPGKPARTNLARIIIEDR